MHYDMQFLVEKIGALLCFLDGFVIASLVLVIRKIQLGHHLYNNGIRLWPTKWYQIILFHELLLSDCHTLPDSTN